MFELQEMPLVYMVLLLKFKDTNKVGSDAYRSHMWSVWDDLYLYKMAYTAGVFIHLGSWIRGQIFLVRGWQSSSGDWVSGLPHTTGEEF